MKETKIQDLIPDDNNFNEGTQYGQHLIEESLRKFGAGRSVLIDKNNRIIAGNKTIENAAAIGLEDVIVVETTGDKIVAVKRTDVDLNSEKGREMALADNATGMANLKWDYDALESEAEKWGIEGSEWGVDINNMDFLEIETSDIPVVETKEKKKERIIIVYKEEQEEIVAHLLGVETLEKDKYTIKDLKNNHGYED